MCGAFEFEILRRLQHLLFQQAHDLGYVHRIVIGVNRFLHGSAGFDFRFDGAANRFLDRLGLDAVLFVVGKLQHAPPRGFVDRFLHGGRDRVGVQNDHRVDVSGSTADCLNERRFAAQKSRLVGIENGDHRHLGKIQTLAQEIDADQRIELSLPQIF